MKFRSINPVNGRLVREVAPHDDAAAFAALAKARAAFEDWSRRPLEERARVVRDAGALLRERAAELAELAADEMGKPISAGEKEVEKSAWVCEHYAEHGAEYLQDRIVGSDASKSYVSMRPLGVVLAVMPWNFPYWQVFRFAAPALVAGNTGLLKHAANVPGCAEEIERVFRDAGAPQGVFTTLFIRHELVPPLLDDPRVAAATLTGSTEAGRAVAAAAGRALKKVVLELGGSDPYVVLADADLDRAVEACAASRLINSGQSCIAAKRFIVEKPIAAAFEKRLVERFRAARSGDPRRRDTELGPMARVDLRDELHRQVQRSLQRGARLVLGGEIPPGEGAFYPPTILAGVAPGMPAYAEELFGPVAALMTADDERDAIRIANDSPFGLGAAVFTKDLERGERVAREELEAGSAFVNAFVRSDPRLPFGGVKASGFGRELSGEGIREFVNIKTIYVA